MNTQIAEYSPTAAALAGLRQKYENAVFDTGTKAGMDKAVAVLEDEVKYLKSECERWVRLYEEESAARKELQQYVRERWGKED